jgi:predicted DNA-binding transcriptional regulator AlpA
MIDLPSLSAPKPDPPTRKRRRLSPLVVDARRLARLLCCGVRTVRTWDAAGKLPVPIRLGGRVVWRVAEIKRWLAAGAPDRETWAAMVAARK